MKLRSEDGRLEESLSRHSGILRDAIQVPAGKKALCQGREGDETGSVCLGLLQDSFLLGLAVEDVVATLVDEAGDVSVPEVSVCKLRRFKGIFGDAYIQRLSGPYDVYQGLEGLFQRRVRVKAVRVEEVYIVQVHSPQALVQAGHEVFAGSPFSVRSGPHVVAGFGRDEKLVPVGGEGLFHNLPEGLFGRSIRRSVVVGQVKVDNPVVKSIVGHFQGAGKGVHVSEVVPQAQGDFRKENTAFSAAAVADAVFVTVWCRGVYRVDHNTSKLAIIIRICLLLTRFLPVLWRRSGQCPLLN